MRGSGPRLRPALVASLQSACRSRPGAACQRGTPRRSTWHGAVRFAEPRAVSIFRCDDPFHDGIPPARGRAPAREGILRRAGAKRRRIRGEGRSGIPRAARAGWGGGCDPSVGGRRREDAGTRCHAVLRPGPGPLFLDVAARVRRGGRMTAVADRFAVRVMVTDVWDQVFLAVEPGMTVAELKRKALTQALKRRDLKLEDYVVKFRGAQVLDESTSLAALGAGANAPFIILPARRQPVR